jgi:regulatory protein
MKGGSITKLAYTKDKKRISIFVDNRFQFAVEKDLINTYELIEGAVIKKTTLERLLKEDIKELCIHKCQELLARRPRSQKELEERLSRYCNKLEKHLSKNDISEIIGSAIGQLKKQHFIDDMQFAIWWLKNRIDFKPRGRILLKQ